VALEADADLEILPFGLLGGGHDLAKAGRVHADGFLHEDVFALLDRLLEHHRAEARGRGQNRHIALGDGLLVTVEAEELTVGRHVHVVAVLVAKLAQRTGQPVLMHVGHGH
jgi:hypothetical protein